MDQEFYFTKDGEIFESKSDVLEQLCDFVKYADSMLRIPEFCDAVWHEPAFNKQTRNDCKEDGCCDHNDVYHEYNHRYQGNFVLLFITDTNGLGGHRVIQSRLLSHYKSDRGVDLKGLGSLLYYIEENCEFGFPDNSQISRVDWIDVVAKADRRDELICS